MRFKAAEHEMERMEQNNVKESVGKERVGEKGCCERLLGFWRANGSQSKMKVKREKGKER